MQLEGVGNGPIEAFSHSLPVHFEVNNYFEQSMSSGVDAQAVSCVEIEIENKYLYGIGIDNDIVVATMKAILSGLNRFYIEDSLES